MAALQLVGAFQISVYSEFNGTDAGPGADDLQGSVLRDFIDQLEVVSHDAYWEHVVHNFLRTKRTPRRM